MKIIRARNPHEALIKALILLDAFGEEQESRNGMVITVPWPVATEYSCPLERVVFWPERDANPFFHLYESLWMLAGRNDLKPLLKYVKNFKDYSDDGKIIHDAYGWRWRHVFGKDQLEIIIKRLQKNPLDRRCVLTMWDPMVDLGWEGKAFPCNLMATFQIRKGKLDLDIFCRSNDIIWGTYGANCFHFSVLLEYMALKIGCPVGFMRQISINWHAYKNWFLPETQIGNLAEQVRTYNDGRGGSYYENNPYHVLDRFDDGFLFVLPMIDESIDLGIKQLLEDVDNDFTKEEHYINPWIENANMLLRAHHVWKTYQAPNKYKLSLKILRELDDRIDIVVAAKQWITRRYTKWRGEKSKFENQMRGYKNDKNENE